MATKHAIGRAGVGLAALYLSVATCAAQQLPGDVTTGQDIATRFCSTCHVVTVEGAGTTRGDVPSFSTIARTSGQTPERLAAAIVIPHPSMPNVPLTRAEIRDVIAYIMSLRLR